VAKKIELTQSELGRIWDGLSELESTLNNRLTYPEDYPPEDIRQYKRWLPRIEALLNKLHPYLYARTKTFWGK